MFSEQLTDIIFKVFTSWQVLVVSVVIVLYFLLVSYVGRTYHRQRIAPIIPKIKKGNKTDEIEVTADDNLGIEEEAQ
ncbi:MAG: hypothetical protein LBQ88_02385 [Treponema sp.]|nr:hypothetical protein [Treponema sp.]